MIFIRYKRSLALEIIIFPRFVLAEVEMYDTHLSRHSVDLVATLQGRRHEFHNGGYKIVNSRAKRAKKIFCPPSSYKLGGYTSL